VAVHLGEHRLAEPPLGKRVTGLNDGCQLLAIAREQRSLPERCQGESVRKADLTRLVTDHQIVWELLIDLLEGERRTRRCHRGQPCFRLEFTRLLANGLPQQLLLLDPPGIGLNVGLVGALGFKGNELPNQALIDPRQQVFAPGVVAGDEMRADAEARSANGLGRRRMFFKILQRLIDGHQSLVSRRIGGGEQKNAARRKVGEVLSKHGSERVGLPCARRPPEKARFEAEQIERLRLLDAES
jgi:hypothetical protein